MGVRSTRSRGGCIAMKQWEQPCHFSVDLKRSWSRDAIDRVNEQFCQKRLPQISNAACIKCFLASGFIIDRCHENDGQIGTGRTQPPLQVDAGVSAKMNVQEETICLTFGDVIEKQFSRCKCLDTESVRRQKAVKTLQHARIVINKCYGSHPIADLMNPPVTLPSNGEPSFAIRGHMTPPRYLRLSLGILERAERRR